MTAILKFASRRFICHNKYIEESELERAVMIQSKEAKQLTYELLENNYIRMQGQELRKTISSTVPSKSLYLFYCDLMIVAWVQLSRCYQISATPCTPSRRCSPTRPSVAPSRSQTGSDPAPSRGQTKLSSVGEWNLTSDKSLKLYFIIDSFCEF